MQWRNSRWARAALSSAVSWFASPRKMHRERRCVRLEWLEERCVPTTITPTTFADGVLGSGSLRDAVLQFNADPGSGDDTIQLLSGTYALTIRNTGGHHETAGLEGDLNVTNTTHRLIIEGAGPSGDNATIIDAGQLQDRVFQIVNPGTVVVFQNLAIRGGLAQDNGSAGALAGSTDALGGGILNNGGSVTLDNVVVQNSVAQGGDGVGRGALGYNARGGGFYSTGGVLTVAGATIANNQAIGGRGAAGRIFGGDGNGGSAGGGGLYATGGSLDISDSRIASNGANGGRGGDGYSTTSGGTGGPGQGGGLYVNGSSLTISDSTIPNNQAIGGHGGNGRTFRGADGGVAAGGGIYASGGLISLTNVMISGSTVRGGNGGNAGASTSGVGGAGPATSGVGGVGGAGQGGGVYASGGMLTLTNATISTNTTSGGNGGRGFTYSGDGGTAQGGGIYASGDMLNLTKATISTNTARGGDGGAGPSDFVGVNGASGGSGQGGGVYASGGMLSLTNTTISTNTSRGGNGGDGGNGYIEGGYGGNGGAEFGGGVYHVSGGTFALTNSTVVFNRAETSQGGAGGSPGGHPGMGQPGQGGGVRNAGGTVNALNTLFGDNTAASNPDFSGLVASSGYNLFGNSSGGSGYIGTDLLDVDPLLGPLQDNGGPTLTHALLAGSPALNAGDPAQLGVADQRGVVRTGGVNIGAFQASAASFVVAASDSITAGDLFDVSVSALDPFGQPAVGYTGTVSFTSADPQGASLPPDYTFTLADAGSHRFIGLTSLFTAGTWDVTVTDTVNTLSGSSNVNVNAGSAVAFQVIAPNSADPGTPFDVTVLAVDAYGNIDTHYGGTIHFTTTDSDPNVVLPPDYQFGPGDGGMASFPAGVTLITSGSQTLTVTDLDSGITGSTLVML